MAKPMTSEQIETQLTETVLDTAGSQPIALARAAFTLGQDNGQAIILERAGELLFDSVADARAMQIGRSVLAIVSWVNMSPDRMWSPGAGYCAAYLSKHEPPFGADEEGREVRYHFEYGSDHVEALSKLATWCTEHAKNSAPKAHDTLPAPADETHLAELAENRAAQDAAMQPVEGLSGF